MKVAILHDYLNQLGGAERVLKNILEIFPEADLYTLLYDKEKTKNLFSKNLKKTSFLDSDFVRRRHRFFIPLMPFAAKFLKSKTVYDLVISSTAGYAKGFGVKGKYHISYCHSPLRYAWEFDYIKNLPMPFSLFPKFFSNPIAKLLRRWDKNSSKNVNIFIANSHYIAEKIHSYYGRDAYVVYPPVDIKKFKKINSDKVGDYYLMAGRFLYYKRFDLGILAIRELRRPLKIVGMGPEEEGIKKLAGTANIEFFRDIPDEKLRKLYAEARALIFPQVEDFGLVAAETQACGTPIIALARGGGSEIVSHKESGILFSEQTKSALVSAIKEFESRNFDREKISKSAERFSSENFKKNFISVVKKSGFSI